jgi:hypothetical protein
MMSGDEPMVDSKANRRRFMAHGILGAVGLTAVGNRDETFLLAAVQDDAAAQSKKQMRGIPESSLPTGKIGNVTISRLILGCNLVSGYVHGRDLTYMSSLVKAYNNEAKVFQTLELAQQCGINTMVVSPIIWPTIVKYNRHRSNKIQTLVNFSYDGDKAKTGDEIKSSIDKGATLVYLHGECADLAVMNGRGDLLGEAIDLARGFGVPVGIGSHSLEVPIACEKSKVTPDFYVKTLHSDRYWSATPKENRKEWCWYKGLSSDHGEFCDNMWCLDAEKTASFMETVEKPWVAFKVMAAGAISPRMAFAHAFRHGADFVLAGMFDFEIETDVKIAIECLQNVGSRKRPWRT